MITGLDRITVQVREVDTAVAAMTRLFARDAAIGEEDAHFMFDNAGLELVLSDSGKDGLAAISFEIADAEQAFRTVERRALRPSAPVGFEESDAAGATRDGRYVALDADATFGVPVKLVQYTRKPAPPAQPSPPDAVTGLDHIVVRTTHPNRAAALYGARLGLDMRLDRTEPKWGSRFMFFRCGDLIIEIVHDLKDEPSDAPDELWGLSWRVADAGAANMRMKAAGFDVSDIRPGRKPGTRVFTVRDSTLGVPTLMLEPVSR